MRKSIVLVVSAISIAVTLAASAGPAAHAGNNVPTRDGGRGFWFVRACHAPTITLGACGAQVITNSQGTPLVTSAAPPPGAYGPLQFHTAYNLPTTAPSTQTIAIVDAYDDPNIEADLNTFSSNYGLPACTTANGCFTKINQTGGSTPPVASSSWALEISLDVETAHAMCQNCKILLVEASTSNLSDLGAAENEAVARGANVISNSWGAREYSTETTDEARYFNHPGVAITASTGDSGYGVQFPAASRYVTAVGGTSLTLNADNTWKSETAWVGAGSGCSGYIQKPAWQTDGSCTRRTVADVSADADPNTGAAVYDSVPYSGASGWFQVGGTSLAAPLIASAYALAGHASSLNGASTAYANASALHDVTSGVNGNCGGSYLCTGKPGYDGPTGLGSPNGLAAFGGSGGGSSPPPPPPPADYSLGISPSSSTVTVGTNAVFNLNVTTTGGFSSTVGFSETGLPNAVFAPASVTGSRDVDDDRHHEQRRSGQLSVHGHRHERSDDAHCHGHARRPGSPDASTTPAGKLLDLDLAVVADDPADEHDDLHRDDHAEQRLLEPGHAVRVGSREWPLRVVLAQPRHVVVDVHAHGRHHDDEPVRPPDDGHDHGNQRFAVALGDAHALRLVAAPSERRAAGRLLR